MRAADHLAVEGVDHPVGFTVRATHIFKLELTHIRTRVLRDHVSSRTVRYG
ncbi:hypothetical protein DSECCO2_619760 [anaerobic digester metagenome]